MGKIACKCGGRAIVQTYVPDHYAIQAAAQHDYQGFYEREMAFRRVHGYPPVGRLVRLVYSTAKLEKCMRETRRVAGIVCHDDRVLLHGKVAPTARPLPEVLAGMEQLAHEIRPSWWQRLGRRLKRRKPPGSDG